MSPVLTRRDHVHGLNHARYDTWGNLYQKSTSGPGEPNVTLTVDTHNRVNGLGGGYTYDAAGYLTFDGANHVTFDAENHMTPAGGTVVYSYDGDDRRVKTITGDGTTQFWYDDSGTVIATTGAWTRDYVYFNGKRIAYFAPSSGNQHYYWSDHLSSARVMSNSNGSSIEWEADYLPFGTKQVVNNFLDNFFLFTGYEFDYEIGDNYAGAGEQSPTLGRFLSADPYAGSMDIGNPQSLNLYSYVLNNPLNATDPSGLECVWDNGSYDSADDKKTGNYDKCAKAGGTWVDHSYFTDNHLADWSSNENSEIANYAAGIATAYGDGAASQGDLVDSMFGQVHQNFLNRNIDPVPTSQDYALEIHNYFANFPNICSLGINGSVGGNRATVGLDANTNKGIHPFGQVSTPIAPFTSVRYILELTGKHPDSVCASVLPLDLQERQDSRAQERLRQLA